jgi:pyruvate dehydrogenase E2 component (dihydrolipoamide acetyltransferase)
MAYLVKMPKLGLEMKEGTVVTWVVGEGEEVSQGDVVAEIESEKSTSEVEARESGVLRRAFLDEGESVAPGTPMGIVAGADEDVSSLEAEAESALGTAAEPEGETETEAEAETEETPAETTASASSAAGASESVRASPRAKQRAEELGVDLAGVEGTGPQNSVTEADVEAAAETASEAAETAEAEPEAAGAEAGGAAPMTVVEETEFGGMRRTIADRLGESYRNAVHVTEHRTFDAEELLDAADAADAALDADVSLPDVLLVALSATLAEHPDFNATYEDGTHRVYAEHNVGVAVDIEAGLVAPVLGDVGSKSLAAVATERREMTRRALDGDYSMDDLSNGTFTVTNLGVLGVESFDPVINPPQVAILGVDALADEVVPTEDGDVTVRKRLPVDLSFDHRVVDGADAARFLETLAGHVENPWPLLFAGAEATGERAQTQTTGEPADGEETPKRFASAHSDAGTEGTVTAGGSTWGFGGDDGSPVDMYAGALAGCLTVFLRLKADEEGISLGTVDVDAEAHPKHGDIERVALSVTVDSDADDETVSRVVDYAEQDCIVRRATGDEIDVDVSWTRA